MEEGEGSPSYGKWVPLCDKTHNIDATEYLIDWWHPWKRVDGPVNCKSCLKLMDYTPEEKNKVWSITYYTKITPRLVPDLRFTKTIHLVAPNRTEATLLFGRNMPEDCAHPRITIEQVSVGELLKEKRML
jgi:hypothetical protein